METLITDKFLFDSTHPFLPSLSKFTIKPNSLKPPFSLLSPHKKHTSNPNPSIICSISASNYGGWEDLNLIEDTKHSGKLDQFQQFLVSIGIDDRTHVFMFLIGFLSALAISRVRVSSILVFPATMLVFGVGFSMGFVQRGGLSNLVKDVSVNGSKRNYRAETFRVCVEKLSNLEELFSRLDGKITNLDKELKQGKETGKLENYHSIIESISADMLSAKKVVESSISDMDSFVSVSDNKVELFDDGEGKKSLNQKSGVRKRDEGPKYFEFLPFFRGLFQENVVSVKLNKVKDIGKRESAEQLNSKVMNKQAHSSDAIEKESPMGNEAMESSSVGDRAGITEVSRDMVNGNSMESGNDIKRLLNDGYFIHQNNNIPFMNIKGNSIKMRRQDENEMLVPYDDLCERVDLGANMKSRENDLKSFTVENKNSLQDEQTLKTSNGASIPSYRRKKSQNGSYKFDLKERREKPEDPFTLGNPQAAFDMEEDSASSSSFISEDVVFDKHLTEGTDLLKQARECLKGKIDEERTEIILYKSARLLNKAIAMKPMSLLAVGQLGNTYLLHGELKLRIARELRALFARSASISRDSRRMAQMKGLDDQITSREKIASTLVDVCEECEELLVEAGRKYRMALSIDGSDVRALYNWGLALSYRAQLIADIGPGAAADADRVYLAAIDKFDAMMSRGNACAPDALFRWGMALQQRSRLRPSNSKEKMKLLHQAKRLFEDVLSMDSNNVRVREALSSCVSELDHRHV